MSNKEISRYENQYKLHIVVHQEGKFVCSQCGKQLITKRYLIQVGKYNTVLDLYWSSMRRSLYAANVANSSSPSAV